MAVNPPSTTSEGAPERGLLRVYLSGGFGLAMSAMVAFLVPLRLNELGVSFDVVGLIVGGGLLAPALLSVSLGVLIDRIGAKRSYVLGTGVTVLGAGLMTTVVDYRWFVLLVPVLGTAISLAWVGSQAYVTALSTGVRQASLTGRFSFVSSLGQMAGPIVAGVAADTLGFRWGLVSIAFYAGVFFLVGVSLVEPGRGTSSAGHGGLGLKKAISLLRVRTLRIAMVLTGTRLWISYVFATFLPLYLVTQGVRASEAGVIVAVSGVVAALVASTAGVLAARAPADTLVIGGLACGAIGLVLAPLLPIGWPLYLIPVLVGVGRGLSLPLLLTIVSNAAPAGDRGVALGLRATVNHLSSALAPSVIGAAIAAFGMILGFAIGGGVAGAALAVALWRR